MPRWVPSRELRTRNSSWLEVISKIFCSNKPLICMILRIASDHVTSFRRASIAIFGRNANAAHFFTRNVGPQFRNLFASILSKSQRLRLPISAISLIRRTPQPPRASVLQHKCQLLFFGSADVGDQQKGARCTSKAVLAELHRECRSVEALAPVRNAACDREHRADMKIKQPTGRQ